jgi:hypothetical protein
MATTVGMVMIVMLYAAYLVWSAYELRRYHDKVIKLEFPQPSAPLTAV